MKKRYLIILLLAFAAAVLYAMFVGMPGYEIWQEPSAFEPNPMEGVAFSLTANRRECEVSIENNGERYVTLEFSRKPIRIEKLEDDGWHRILTQKHFFAEPWVVGVGDRYDLTIKWSKLLGGNLKPGSYRAILFHGDGWEDVYYFSTIYEFTVA